MHNWYVLFVQSGEEENICGLLNKLCKHKYIAFYPKIKKIYYNKKRKEQGLVPMFPGYVFIETKMQADLFIKEIMPTIRKTKLIYNLLGKDNPKNMGVYDKEKRFLLKFCDNQYIVRESIGYIEGERVYIISGPLQGFESVIKRIDRHKRIAEVQMQFMGDTRRIKVALEVVRKI
ncbi:antiterminator LoaP [Vallitalea maricola]|uniref:UpxY family transcription antiterminator n=1 Tax=Vallitalea maricola TaxID=3074433 RepID=A0ACB5UK84_9FIRM|nr:UpxY family transcription antiterminator [Vallitalea sp. AN17-2]